MKISFLGLLSILNRLISQVILFWQCNLCVIDLYSLMRILEKQKIVCFTFCFSFHVPTQNQSSDSKFLKTRDYPLPGLARPWTYHTCPTTPKTEFPPLKNSAYTIKFNATHLLFYLYIINRCHSTIVYVYLCSLCLTSY